MFGLLAVLVSGVLLNAMDVPVPDYHHYSQMTTASWLES